MNGGTHLIPGHYINFFNEFCKGNAMPNERMLKLKDLYKRIILPEPKNICETKKKEDKLSVSNHGLMLTYFVGSACTEWYAANYELV